MPLHITLLIFLAGVAVFFANYHDAINRKVAARYITLGNYIAIVLIIIGASSSILTLLALIAQATP